MATTPQITKKELRVSALDVNLPREVLMAKLAADAALPADMSARDRKHYAAKVVVVPTRSVEGMSASLATGLSNKDFMRVHPASINQAERALLLTTAEAEAARVRRITLIEASLSARDLARIKARP
ncbi:MAG: hypothetical protein JKY94_16745 [Rhodobacteraceae bacterium]|nr:hypothetical protein [Paracoccaceae bacterium]